MTVPAPAGQAPEKPDASGGVERGCNSEPALGRAEPDQPPRGAATREPTERGGHTQQPRNPLHGVTLETMVTALVEYFSWDGLGERIPVRCFNVDPSVPSSLRFLRKTPWAREKVEGLYLFMLREQRRSGPQA